MDEIMIVNASSFPLFLYSFHVIFYLHVTVLDCKMTSSTTECEANALIVSQRSNCSSLSLCLNALKWN